MNESSLTKEQGQQVLRLSRWKMWAEIALFGSVVVAMLLFGMLSAPAYVGHEVALYGGIFTNVMAMAGLVAMIVHIRRQLKPFDYLFAPDPKVVRVMKATAGLRFVNSASRWIGLVVWCLLMLLGYLWFCDPEFHAAWEQHGLRLFFVAAGGFVILVSLTLVFHLSDKKLAEMYAELDPK